MARREGCRIAVIGAGFSGAMTAIHLLWRCRPGERVYLIERSGRIGPGVAYGSTHPRHLVNVRAENMSAFADEPEHFLHWLEQLPPEERAVAGERTIAGTFVRRSIYGRYIQDLLREAITRQDGADNLFLIADQATGVRRVEGGLQLATASGRNYEVDAIVLALGNLLPERTPLPGYLPSPWVRGFTQGLVPDQPVVLLGTGLTMADTALALFADGFEGPVHAISRRGLLPLGHGPSVAWPELRLDVEDRRSLLALFCAVRREVRRAQAQGVGWRAVIDALRPHAQLLWQEMALADKQRFLRHVRPYWDVHRHRMAPTAAATLASLRAADALRIETGRITGLRPEGKQIEVSWTPRRATGTRSLLAQRVIDCTGLATDYAALSDPLIRQLLDEGMVRPAAMRLGLDCSRHGNLIAAEGEPSRELYAVGPITRGALWEIIAVPEIRSQAEQVAISVLATARGLSAAAA
ncbi:MAG: FAD/NAD(P)-binding protein [Geminicoccaceae bacterium]